MKEKIIKIDRVLPDSIAEEAGIEAGDILVTINHEKVADVFDYRFLIASENLLLEIQKPDGELWEVEIEKDEYEDLGMEFENSMLDDARSCTNKCIFCFIDQLPKGMRNTLYFKDDDSRLSFLTGNYVTLTNMSDSDIDRIIKYKMSPINVSVHTTNPDLRVSMLNNRFAGDVLAKIHKLVDAGITVNSQIVLCRGINDDMELDRSISDLVQLYPGVRSLSVVPVGITKHRGGLAELRPYDRQASEIVVAQVEGWQESFLNKYGSRIVYIADEFYIMAGRQIPEYQAYEDFPQIENGVGLIALLKYEIYEVVEKLQTGLIQDFKRTGEGISRRISIATGSSAYPFIKNMAEYVGEKYPYIKVDVYEIKNYFFGENVTVAGLLTGRDIVGQLKGRDLGDELLISRSMLRAGESILLDDYHIEMLEEELKVKIVPVESSGKDFVEKILGINI